MRIEKYFFRSSPSSRTSLFFTLLFAIAFSLSACHNDDPETVKVGLVLPLSGSLATLGEGLQNVADLALEEANSTQAKKIQFVIEDSGSTAEGATEAFNKLIEENSVTSILGPVTSTETQAAFPIAQQRQIVGFSPLAAAQGLSEIGDFVFQGNLTVDVVIPGGVEITAAKIGYKKVAVLVDTTDLFSQSAFDILEQTFIDKGIDIISTETLQTNDDDFSAQLTRIKDAKPDAVFISMLPIEAVKILTQARAAGIPDTVTFIVPLAFSTDEIDEAGAAAEGVVTFSTWISSAPTPGNQAFVENYRALFGSEPSRFLAQEYACVHILSEAINKAQATDSFAIRDALANIRSLDTILGKFSFDASGHATYDPIILIVKNGVFEVFE